MKEKPLISIVVLNWNGKKFMKDVFSSIERQTFRDFEAIMVDNGSTDDSIAYVKKKFPFVRILPLEKNFGFSKGNNHGFENALGEWIIALNNDTKLDNDFLKHLANTIKRNKNRRLGSICPKMFLYDKSKIDTMGHLLTPFLLGKDCKTDNKIHKLIGPCGGAAVYNSKMLKDINLNKEYYDVDFFIYSEDFDLNLRAYLKGWDTTYCADAIVYHVHSGTMKLSNKAIILGSRNGIWTIMKNVPLSDMIILSPFILSIQLASLMKHSIKMPKDIFSSKIEAFKGIKLMLKKRKRIQKTRRRNSFFRKLTF